MAELTQSFRLKEIEPRSTVSMGGTLALALPDWASMDVVLCSNTPFALWQVGDQPLLYHWLDYAVNCNIEQVVVYASDRPDVVRRYLQEAKLWPIDWELKAVPSVDKAPVDAFVCHLPEEVHPDTLPTDGWELLDYWFSLQSQWLNRSMGGERACTWMLGRFCKIHPSSVIHPPVWLGDNVQIGPGCEIGPYACLGSRVFIEGPSTVAHARVEHNTYLAGNTELKHAYLAGGRLLNLKHRGAVQMLDAVVAGSLVQSRKQVALWERGLALMLGAVGYILGLFSQKKTRHKWMSWDGKSYTERVGAALLVRRASWLFQVVLGKMNLVGVLPRSESAWSSLSPEWQSVLKEAPCGVFSYADLQGVHDAEDPREAVHAVYQAVQPKTAMAKMVLASLWSLLYAKD